MMAAAPDYYGNTFDASPSQGVIVCWRCSWLYLMRHCLLSMCFLVLKGPG